MLLFSFGVFIGCVVCWLINDVLEFADFWRDPTVAVLIIKLKGKQMAKVGEPVAIEVVALNEAGRQVIDTGITVTSDNGTVTVATDGKVGSFTAAKEGDVTLVATDGKFTSAPFVQPATDERVASLEIRLAAPSV